MSKPRNIILLVVDSLRYDSVNDRGSKLPYLEKHGANFTRARSSGCWTLPATTSMFTGLMPHEHGATSQTRGFKEEIPTLAELMKEQGYNTYQVTGNPVTTHIFGLNRGFDKVIRIWDEVEPRLKRIMNFVVMAGKPRVRKMMFSKDVMMERMSEDLKVGVSWTQTCYNENFDIVRKLIEENEAKGKGSFIFINLMEAHFPYHVADTIKLTAKGWVDKYREAKGLYDHLNQTFLKTEKEVTKPHIEKLIRERQYTAWDILSKPINDFVQEMHQDKDNLVIFCSDHGDNFGDQNWIYHFSNVTDAGNRVPLYWLWHDHREEHTRRYPVSSRHMFYDILRAAEVQTDGPTLFDESPENLPVLSSYWYNNQGKTLEKYYYNQLGFIEDDHRYVYRDNKEREFQWLSAPAQPEQGGAEPDFKPCDKGFDPLEEAVQDSTRKQYLQHMLKDFRQFSDAMPK